MRIFILILLIGCLCFSCKEQHNTISISGRQILTNNQPYIIKGICYHPVQKGSKNRSFETLGQDLTLMQEASINTIRVYKPITDITVLDKINEANMKIVLGFGYDQGGVFDIKSGTFIDYVNKYKTHPAILMWELGNEYNYHPEWFEGDIKNWYKAMNNAAAKIHKTDPNHPVTTAHGELPDELALNSSPNIDVWGINVYRWDNPGTIYTQWKTVSNKPMYFSEAGGDSYMTIESDGFSQGINEDAQAVANKNILNSVFNNIDVCLGVTMFSFTDGWWKAGNPNQQDIGGWAPKSSGVPYDGSPNEEYWGIVDIDRHKKKTFEVIKAQYLKKPNE
ncbi:glycoside hydrolase family 2 TIM barrel-domain containing protein [Flavivirga aquimarina]|uniref:Glycoside hydrolase family 2 TIM barrel-domain containing protein n=1 Tax=Flavivirga aquimarina TaxID=2027862 RepID=A0ABT8W7T0_9FLAO|nr:glycoside hydrolase family 2 TIM barrel-domain containing protein [Flavivirga aquimarina]MDO5969185.1 glycoside hydrolase family 2 TIM barrel-domain containing protein [Flavivirga aquimarina]